MFSALYSAVFLSAITLAIHGTLADEILQHPINNGCSDKCDTLCDHVHDFQDFEKWIRERNSTDILTKKSEKCAGWYETSPLWELWIKTLNTCHPNEISHFNETGDVEDKVCLDKATLVKLTTAASICFSSKNGSTIIHGGGDDTIHSRGDDIVTHDTTPPQWRGAVGPNVCIRIKDKTTGQHLSTGGDELAFHATLSSVFKVSPSSTEAGAWVLDEVARGTSRGNNRIKLGHYGSAVVFKPASGDKDALFTFAPAGFGDSCWGVFGQKMARDTTWHGAGWGDNYRPVSTGEDCAQVVLEQAEC